MCDVASESRRPGCAGGCNDVDAIISSMTLEERVGQMLMVGFDEQSLTPDLEGFLREFSVGNLIFLGRNIVDPAQTRQFTLDLQRMAQSRRIPIGFLTAVDQEGGVVARMLSGVTVLPGNMAIGATGSPEYARMAAEVTAREMLAVGFNMNLAPVLDVNNNPNNPGIGVRSYGENPQTVALLGTCAIEGTQSSGVVATAKHFPGKGDVTIDSHIDLPHVPHSRSRIDSVELVPFKAAIKAGVAAIMTAHVTFPSIEPEPLLPATMSHRVLTGLLRDELEFDGLIITDDLFMGAISKTYGLAEAGIRAIMAGADIVLMCHKPEEQRMAIPAIVHAVESGRITEERINASVRRVLSTKARFGILSPPISSCGQTRLEAQVGTPANRALALEIARKAVTLVRNERGIIPVDASRVSNLLVVSPDVQSLTMVEDTGFHGSPLFKAVQRIVTESAGPARAAGIAEIVVSQKPTQSEIAEAAASAVGRDLVVVGTYNGHLYPEQGELVRRIAEAGVLPVVVAMRNPYDIRDFPEVDTYIAAYGFRECNMQAAAELIFGAVKASGRLPVTIPGLG